MLRDSSAIDSNETTGHMTQVAHEGKAPPPASPLPPPPPPPPVVRLEADSEVDAHALNCYEAQAIALRPIAPQHAAVTQYAVVTPTRALQSAAAPLAIPEDGVAIPVSAASPVAPGSHSPESPSAAEDASSASGTPTPRQKRLAADF